MAEKRAPETNGKNTGKLAGLFQTTSKPLYSVITILMVVLLMAASFFGYYGINLITKNHEAQIDMTSAKMFTMNSETTTFVKGITKDVQIIVLESEKDYGTNLSQQNEVLKNYVQCNSAHIELIYADPTTDPTYLNKYSFDNVELGDVIVVCGARYTVVKSTDLYSEETDQNTGFTIEYSNAEDSMNSALIFVVSDDVYTVGFISGHNEVLSTELADFLNNNVYVTKAVNLSDVGVDLSEFDILVSNGPTSDFTPEELKLLDAFLYNDGKFGRNFAYFAAFSKSATPNLDGFLKEYGLEVTDNIVYDLNSEYYYLNSPLSTYVEVPASESSYGVPLADKTNITDYRLLSPYNRVINLVTPQDNIASTTTNTRVMLGCYNDTSVITTAEKADTYDFKANAADPAGDYIVAAASTIMSDAGESRVLVYGSNQIIADAMIKSGDIVNNQYIMCQFGNWVKHGAIYPYVSPTNLTGEVFTPSDSVAIVLMLVLVVLPIVAVIAVGVTVFVKRRHS